MERNHDLKNNLRGEMDRAETDDRRRTGSVKAAVNSYGERVPGGKRVFKKPQMAFSEKPPSKAKELYLAKRDIERFHERGRVADSVIAEAESELNNTRNEVKNLSLRFEESNSRVKAQKKEIETLKKLDRHDDGLALADGKADIFQYAEVMRELESIKQELSKLKLDMASVLEAKLRAEKLSKASVSRLRSYSSSKEALRKEVEEANEEQVLVQLAKIEAVRELGAIEAQREVQAVQFSNTIEETRNRIKDIIQELDRSKELEAKLAMTASDIDALQKELKLVKGMDKRVVRNENLGDNNIDKGTEEELQTSILLQSVTEELDAAKKDLASVKEEGYRFMASMDTIRDQRKHVSEETAQSKNLEEKANLTVQNLNHKLHRAKSKLEAASAAEQKEKGIVSNLTMTLQQLQTEALAAKKERDLISEETSSIQAEIQKTESEMDLVENRLEAAMKELEAAKASEAKALENLKDLTEKTMRARASISQHSSSITIPNFEYVYLTGRAEDAEEIADKKLAAAQAWVKALKASEKQILMKTDIVYMDIRELRLVEEQHVYRTEKSLKVKRAAEDELHNYKQQHERHTEAAKLQVEKALPRKSMKDGGILSPARQARPRRPSSPGIRYVNRSPSITLRKKRKEMPNLIKLFSRKRTGKDL